MPAFGGSIPQQYNGPEVPGARRLFYSRRDTALLLDKTFQGGYGVLKAGTLVCLNTANNKLVPYVRLDHDNDDVGRAYLMSDYGTGDAYVEVSLDESRKFEVGDSLAMVRDNSGSPAYHDLGAITAIDRTTYKVQGRARITITTSVADANFTVANKANVYVKTDAAEPYTGADYVLDQDIDTGYGQDENEQAKANGALSSVVVSNAILYMNSCPNYDSAGATDLGATTDGQFLILK